MHKAFYMNFQYTMTSLLVALMAGIFFVDESPAQPSSPYHQGLEQLYRGQVEEALDTWETNYSEESRVDARIGFEYIRIITEREFNDRFETATEMYYKALMNGSGTNSRIAVRQEIERLKAIVGDGIYRQWTEWWEQENSRQLRSDIRGFWIQLDPTPARTVNERLIEHWQRIAVARERFTKNSSTIFGTDERAMIFVRYGEPDRVQNGLITLQELDVKPWLQRQIIRRDNRRSDHTETGRPENEPEMPQLQEESLEFVIYDYHRYPEFEVWFYDEIAVESNEPVPFLFGTNARTDQFELVSSVEDFIPETAFNTSVFEDRDMATFTRAGITPAIILQMLYYEQLSSVDSFFEERLNSLRDDILEQGREAFSGLDLQFRDESASLVRQRVSAAPRQISTIESHVPAIPLDVYQYRFLDEEQNPYIVTFLESNPREAFMIDFTRSESPGRDISTEELRNAGNVSSLLPDYSLLHSLQKYDDSWDVIDRSTEDPSFTLERNPFRPGALTVFRSAHNSRAQQSASVELENMNEDSAPPAWETPYPKSTRGLGSTHFRQPAPLNADPDSLQMADLVLGYGIEETDDEGQLFPFNVANNQTIPWQETLALHIEVYNLGIQDNGFSRFELTYRILPIDERGRVLTDQSEFVLTLNFTSETNRLVEDLEIETADLRPGLYELRVSVTDIQTGQTQNRNTRFEVLD